MAMDMNDLMNQVEARALKDMKKHPPFEIGDVVDVGVKIKEGDKERVQVFNGRVIAMRGGGLRSYFTVRRIVDNEGVERDFPLYSPLIDHIRVKSHGKARRAKLFFLRERVGKQTRLREVLVGEEQGVAAEGAEAAADKKKGKKRGAKAKAERQTRAAEMQAQKAEARRKKRAAKKAEKAGAAPPAQG
jgi:large subunit ribosomal protein L19